MKNFVIELVNERRKYFQADSWETSQAGHLVFRRGTDPFMVVAYDKWIWFSPEAEDHPAYYRLDSEISD